MTMKTEESDKTLTAFLSGEIDHHTAKTAREQIDYAVERGGIMTLRLDFSDVSFMDSSGVGLVMGRYRLLQSRGGNTVVQNATPPVMRMLKLAGLDRLPVWEKEENHHGKSKK